MQRKEVEKYFGAVVYDNAADALNKPEITHLNNKLHYNKYLINIADQKGLPTYSVFLGLYKNDDLHSVEVPTGAISNSAGKLVSYGWFYQGYVHRENSWAVINSPEEKQVNLAEVVYVGWFVYGIHLTHIYDKLI